MSSGAVAIRAAGSEGESAQAHTTQFMPCVRQPRQVSGNASYRRPCLGIKTQKEGWRCGSVVEQLSGSWFILRTTGLENNDGPARWLSRPRGLLPKPDDPSSTCGSHGRREPTTRSCVLAAPCVPSTSVYHMIKMKYIFKTWEDRPLEPPGQAA